MTTWLVTGGAGFIGSAFVLSCRAAGCARIVTLDTLTYAGRRDNLAALDGDPDHLFVTGDIGDRALVRDILDRHSPDAIIHFAAESHVDRSILDPGVFLQTNVMGTYILLDEARRYHAGLSGSKHDGFRFLQVSTDEVFGTLDMNDPPFDEHSPYAPNSPYAASKAGADHLARAYHRTYGLPVLVTNCSNNYGPRQYPEKLIPLMILQARAGKSLPVYGDGSNIRDWIYVDDHCDAIRRVIERGTPGNTYPIGGGAERSNLDVVHALCRILDERLPDSPACPHESLITFVNDRPGHDRRYAIDSTTIQRELGWSPRESFESGLARTVDWYLANDAWIDGFREGGYRTWMERNYADRTGMSTIAWSGRERS